MIRLYAQLSASFKTVSEGLREGFEDLGVLAGYVVGEQQEFDSDLVGGATAPVAVVVGDPGRVWMAHRQGSHNEVWLMLAPNSEGIPGRIKQEITTVRHGRKPVAGLLAPSTWAQKVLEREFPTLPVRLCQHGVLKAFVPKSEWLQSTRDNWNAQKQMVALHVTSTVSRKGTRELCDAWSQAIESGEIQGQLLISCNPRFMAEFEDVIRGREHIRVIPGQGMRAEALAELYQMVNIVVQPSRAEGFGLVPLEARACGVPVAMTICTGHADQIQFGGGVVAILEGPLAESDDYWGSRSHLVKVDEVRLALCKAYRLMDMVSASAQQSAAGIRKHWTWARGASQVVEEWKLKYVRAQHTTTH